MQSQDVWQADPTDRSTEEVRTRPGFCLDHLRSSPQPDLAIPWLGEKAATDQDPGGMALPPAGISPAELPGYPNAPAASCPTSPCNPAFSESNSFCLLPSHPQGHLASTSSGRYLLVTTLSVGSRTPPFQGLMGLTPSRCCDAVE